MKVQLVIPEQDLGKSFNSGMYYSLGVLSIASYLDSAGIKVEIIDSEVCDNIKTRIINGQADIIGISCNSFNYQEGLKIAQLSKSAGKIVIMGGPHATYFAETILAKRSFVDYIIKGPGEKALLEIIQNRPLENINNLVYRDHGKIISNYEEQNCLYQQINLNYDLIKLNDYWDIHKRSFPFLPREVMIYFSHTGCRWREKTNGCIFCAIRDPQNIFQDPKKIWSDFRLMKEKYGVKIIKDYGDDITSNREWLKNFLKQRPYDMKDMRLSVYGSTRFIDDEIIDLLYQLNVSHVFIGFESGNNKILKAMNKGATAQRNWEVAKKIIDKKINIFASYILGGPGETEQSMLDTKNLAIKIANYGSNKGTSGRNLVELSNASPFIPMPGSRAYKQLYVEKNMNDIFDCDASIKLWIKNQCHFKSSPEESYKNIIQLCDEISILSPQKNYLGWKK